MFKSFQDENAKIQFLESQFSLVLELQNKLKIAEEENLHLKELLISNVPHLNLPLPVIITPEEYLIDSQISILENRGRQNGHELTLEECKKLDILLKHKKIIKEGKEVIKADKPKSSLSKKELALIATSKKDEANEL